MSETQALVVPETKRAIITREVLTEAAEQRKLLGEYVRQQMIENTDYGVIPGTQKPTLLKPGAEKLVDLFRCTPICKLIKTVEDYDHNLFAYTFRIQLLQRDINAVLAEGYGSANSREGRYRWRNANRKCPACGKETIIKGKEEYGGGWICFAKKGGCGAKFKDGDQVIEGQAQGQVENEDVAALANTILKMAKKRALVDGAIALARVSDMFTQDVEDLPGGVRADDVPPRSAEDEQRAGTARPQHSGNGHTRPAPPPQQRAAPQVDAASSALAEEFSQGIAQAKDAATIGHIIASVAADHKAHKLNDLQAKALKEAIISRRQELGIAPGTIGPQAAAS